MVDHIALALQSQLYQTCSATPAWSPKARGGLDKEVTIAQLADDCGLSTSQFARAFRQSTDRPPHRWLRQRRVERAQELLLTSDKTLAEITRACGFNDQTHLTRVFGKTVGTSPGVWRRIKRT
jgi:transcriptional regulator GlxA family with amidase domain